MPPGLESLAYEAAIRSLDKQERVLDELRARTGLLLAAASVAAGLLGRPAVGRADSLLVALAVASFLVSISASVYVLLPKQSLVFSLVGPQVYEEMFDLRGDMAEVQRRLTYDLDRFWRQNNQIVVRLIRGVRIVVFAVVAEIAFLVASAGGSLF